MKRVRLTSTFRPALPALACLAALMALQASASACAACMGGDNEQLVEASNTVLWALLGLVGFIFVSTGATVWFLWKKSQAPVPPDLALLDSIIPPTNQGKI